jgi:hypothetical protein
MQWHDHTELPNNENKIMQSSIRRITFEDLHTRNIRCQIYQPRYVMELCSFVRLESLHVSLASKAVYVITGIAAQK